MIVADGMHRLHWDREATNCSLVLLLDTKTGRYRIRIKGDNDGAEAEWKEQFATEQAARAKMQELIKRLRATPAGQRWPDGWRE